jgi:hypothetical protein
VPLQVVGSDEGFITPRVHADMGTLGEGSGWVGGVCGEREREKCYTLWSHDLEDNYYAY